VIVVKVLKLYLGLIFMRKLKGLTKLDVVVALACIAFILAEASVLNAGGRERSKRELCLANLRMLTAAWQAYADDNGSKIVNGAPQVPNPPSLGVCPDCTSVTSKAVAPINSSDEHYKELPWIGETYGTRPECTHKCAIETGALWKYTQSFDIYHCPASERNILITYTIFDEMNGLTATRGPVKTDGVWKKNINQISKPASRFVFIDEGKITPDSFGVYYDQQKWFDQPSVRHESGTCVTFADGHSIHHKWKSKETIGFSGGGGDWTPYTPVTCDAKNDLYWVQIGCWGQLGYTPNCPVAPE
jgi:hypothetical protein